MKKILFSLAMIVVVAGVVAGGTIAFFNDTETSTGNIFTAGSIDLKVDHTLQTYNGNQVGGTLTIVSDNQTQVNNHPAVPVGSHIYDAAWTAVVPSATWIWEEDPENDSSDVETFTRTFNWTGGTVSSATLLVASDNSFSVDLNSGSFVASAPGNHYAAGTEVSYDVTGDIVPGSNTLVFVVDNELCTECSVNPGGLKFRLDIDGEETTWATPVDLDDETFFDFDDVKPGDYGTNVVSLHVDDNDAYSCLIPTDFVDLDNNVTEPELPDDNTEGELSDYLEFFVWKDNGDGVYQNTEQVLSDAGTNIADIEMVAMQLTGGGPTGYVGLSWCAGDQTGPTTTNSNIPLACDGNGMGDIAQTDSMTASLVAYAEQVRNNPNFSCADVDLGGDSE